MIVIDKRRTFKYFYENYLEDMNIKLFITNPFL